MRNSQGPGHAGLALGVAGKAVRAKGAPYTPIQPPIGSTSASHQGPRARTDEHSAILDALRLKDPTAARIAMRDHVHRLFEALLSAQEATALAEMERKLHEDRERFLITTRI